MQFALLSTGQETYGIQYAHRVAGRAFDVLLATTIFLELMYLKQELYWHFASMLLLVFLHSGTKLQQDFSPDLAMGYCSQGNLEKRFYNSAAGNRQGSASPLLTNDWYNHPKLVLLLTYFSANVKAYITRVLTLFDKFTMSRDKSVNLLAKYILEKKMAHFSSSPFLLPSHYFSFTFFPSLF